jgi:hypothetical protein
MTSENLSDVYGVKGARSGGLADRLPRRARPTSTPPAVDSEEAAPAAPPRVVGPIAAPVSPAATPTAATTRQVTVYVLPHVPAAIRKGRAGRSNADVVYDAVDAIRDRIGELLAARRDSPSNGSLFARERRHRTGEGRVSWSFNASPANRSVLDQLANTHGTTRSELVSIALEATYPPA